jgi:hypothetical protein
MGPARRPQPVGEMLAAKGRAGGRQSRAALLRTEPQTEPPDKPAQPAVAAQPSTPTPSTRVETAARACRSATSRHARG